MKRYVLYDPATGAIRQTGHCLDADLAQMASLFSGAAVLEYAGSDHPEDRSHYVDVSGAVDVVRQRAPNPSGIDKATIATTGADAAVISGIPPGSEVYVNGALIGVTEDGQFQLTSDAPATFEVRIKAPPSYLDAEYTIHAA